MRVLAWPARANQNLNPYNALLTDALEPLGVTVVEWTDASQLEDADVLHLHWPEASLNLPDAQAARNGIQAVLEAMTVAQSRGTRIVWTAHNLRPHAGAHPALGQEFWQAFCPMLDGVIALSEASARAVRNTRWTLEAVPMAVIPHGHYRDAYPNTIGQAAAQALLRIPMGLPTVAFVGQLRAYKGLPDLLEAFRALPLDARLLVAGKPVPPEDAVPLGAIAYRDARVRLEFGFVPDERLQVFLNAADLIVLPYRQVLNSGSALLALSFDRPVLAPAQGSLPELAQAVGGGWVRLYEGVLSANALREALEASAHLRGQRAPLQSFDWAGIAQRTLAFYQRLTER